MRSFIEEEFALIEAGSKGLRELRWLDIRRFYILVEKVNRDEHVRLQQEGVRFFFGEFEIFSLAWPWALIEFDGVDRLKWWVTLELRE